MHAALLLAMVLFGAPTLPGGQHADPAGEAGHEPGLAGVVARVVALSEPLLRAPDRTAFLAALDLAALELDLSSLALQAWRAGDFDDGGPERRRSEALAELEAAVGPAWRGELRDGVALAASLGARLGEHPEVTAALRALAGEDAPTVHEVLGDPARPEPERRRLLQYLHGLVCAGALTAAAERGQRLPDWLAGLTIARWRGSLAQADALLRAGSVGEPASALEASPLAELLLRFQCQDGPRIAGLVRRDPAVVASLLAVRERVALCFPEVERVVLRPTWDPEGAEDPALMVRVHTSQSVAEAEAALARFDDWWLERSLQAATRVVVDVRLS